MRTQIITNLYNSRELKEVISKMQPSHLRDELLSEVMLVVCELDDDRLNEMQNKGYLTYYVIKTILNMVRSNNSQFHNKFRKIYEELGGKEFIDSNDSDEMELMYESAESFHKSLSFYEGRLLESYINLESNANKLAKETGIPVRSIYHTINTIRKKAKLRDRKKQKIKFNIECTMMFPESADTDEILDGLDIVMKTINDIKNKNFKPICLKIQ